MYGLALWVIGWRALKQWRADWPGLSVSFAMLWKRLEGWVYAAVILATFGFLAAQMYQRPKGQYASADAARVHCPSDTVVWLNTDSGVFHLAGERWYGSTRHGAFECLGNVTSGGARVSMNGQ